MHITGPGGTDFDALQHRRNSMGSSPASSWRALRLVIHGRVQGVFYRDSMRREAQTLGVSGWVRNCGDGTVEAEVQGETAAVDAIVRWAQRGPVYAQAASYTHLRAHETVLDLV